jgi:membrane protease YdiL (CAAX protease family)
MAAAVHALLVLFLVFVFPVWDRREAARLKAAAGDAHARVRSYQKTIAWQLVATAALLLTVPLRDLFTSPAGRTVLGVKPSPDIVLPLLVGLSLGALVPVIILKLKARGNRALARASNPLESIAFFLPRTRRERWWFAGMCLVVGACEEIIFRGFLIRYFAALPLHVGLAGAVLLSAAVFGIDHGYQGWKGVLGTSVLALVMTALFLVTGSLWVPILVHVLIDLRVLLMLPGDPDLPEERPLPD